MSSEILGAQGGSTRNPFSYSKVEQLNRDVITPWLTLDEITQQLNLFNDESQDTYLSSLELATRFAIEDYLGMSIFSMTYRAANPLQTYPAIKQAGLLLLTHLYNQRSNSTEASLKSIPFGVDTLLRPYKELVM